MAAGRAKSFRRVGSLMRSKSEGTLIDLDDNVSTSDNLNGEILLLKCKQNKNLKKKKKLLIMVADVSDRTVLFSQVGL